MNRNEAIEIAAKGIADNAEASVCEWDWCVPENQADYRSYAVAAYDALLAAGVIPAEGTVVVNAKRWNRIVTVAEAAKDWVDAPSGNIGADTALITYADALHANDLDAIPAAPTGEEAP